MTKHTQILLEICTNIMATRDVLELEKNVRTSQHEIQTAIEKNEIQENTLAEKKGPIRRTLTYYTITRDGLIRLARQKDPEWCKYISKGEIWELHEPAFRFTMPDHIKKKFIQVSIAKIMSNAVGACTKLFTTRVTHTDIKLQRELNNAEPDLALMLSDNNEDDDANETAETAVTKNTIRNIIYNAIDSANMLECIRPDTMDYQTQNPNNRNYIPQNKIGNLIRFTDSWDIKRQCLSELNDENDKYENKLHEFDKCMLDGILESSTEMIVLYSSILTGCSWNTWNIKQDIVLVKMWYENHSITKHKLHTGPRQYTAGIIVKNAQAFNALYSDTTGRDECGAGYDTCYIIPISYYGVQMLTDILTVSEQQHIDMIQQTINQIGYAVKKNDYWQTTLFPYYYTNGTEKIFVYDGTYLNVNTMRTLETFLPAAEKNSDDNADEIDTNVYDETGRIIPQKKSPQKKQTIKTRRTSDPKKNKYKEVIICYDWQIDYYKKIFYDVPIITLLNKIQKAEVVP